MAVRFKLSEHFSSDKLVICVASGPSLTNEQCNIIKQAHATGKVFLIVVNDGYRLFPKADIVYATDFKWWDWHWGTILGVVSLETKLVTTNEAALLKFKERLQYLEGVKEYNGFLVAQGKLHTGKNSGFAALNLAVNLGAKRILLVGYDMRKHTEQEDRKTGTYGLVHWFGNHPGQNGPQNYKEWIRVFKGTVGQLEDLGVEVINCTPRSALKCYKESTLEIELCELLQ